MHKDTIKRAKDYIEGIALIKAGTIGGHKVEIDIEKLSADDIDTWCLFCQKTNKDDVFFHAYDANYQGLSLPNGYGICENCANEFGCSCGCYPSMVDKGIATMLDCELERNDDGDWIFNEPYSNPSFKIFVKKGHVSIHSFIALEIMPFVNAMRDIGIEVW